MSEPFFGVSPRACRVGLALAFAGALLAAPDKVSAQIYSSAADDGAGALVLSNFESAAAPRLLLAGVSEPDATVALPASAPTAGPLPAGPVLARKASSQLTALIDGIAREVQVSSALIHAVIAQESNFDPYAISPKGAMGLMQLLPQTATRFGAREAFDPGDNIRAGALYLRWLAAKFDNRLDLVLAAYNAGEQTVVRAGWQVPGYPETRNYVRRVLADLRCPGAAACTVMTAGLRY